MMMRSDHFVFCYSIEINNQMKTGRLKALNKQIEDMFAEPLTHHRWAGIKESGGMEYIRCGLCE